MRDRPMPQQGSFSQAEYASKKKQTRRDKFLAEMERVVPWTRLVARLRPPYPKGGRGPPPVALERMLRIHFLEQWYALADQAMEEALYDSQALRGFAGIDLAVDTVPDETTILNFRHWLERLERHDLSRSLFEEVGAMLEERGLLMRQSLPRRRPGGRLSMPRSSPPRPRPRTNGRAATRRCTRPGKATSGTSA